MDKFAEFTDEALAELIAAKRTEGLALVENDDATDEDIASAEALATEVAEAEAEVERRTTAATERAESLSSLKGRFSVQEPEEVEEPAKEEDPEEPEEPEVEAEVEEKVEAAVKPTPKVRKAVASLAQKVERPPVVKKDAEIISITAAADSGFAAGSTIDMAKVGEALVNRVKGFSPPNGDGRTEDIRKFPVASFRIAFPDELTVKSPDNAMEVLDYAADETRLEGDSLVAAGGWCAPSENLYDLCAGETLEGILSVPEINVSRGGINFTKGPDFGDLYGSTAFFTQTEAEAIAGDPKSCYEIECPDFTEVRLDATGLCLKIPILTNAGYPELINRVTSGTMVAFQHKLNADVIGRMVILAGAARVIVGLGSTAQDTLAGLTLLADEKREQYRLSLSETLEVVVPFWVKNAIKNDLRIRTGQERPVTDQQVNAEFAAHNLNVQFVYDWQGIGQSAEVYPDTYNALMYPAGTYVKGTADVINLSAVYDAASLAENVYTGTFMEQGILVANRCYTADLVTLPICNAGRTGAAEFTCA